MAASAARESEDSADGEARSETLFGMIRTTHEKHPQGTVVAYSDNAAVMQGARIARFYPGARRENVLVTNGGSEANYAVFWSLLEKGDRVACMLPNYLQTWGLARIYSGSADPFRLEVRTERGGRRM